MLQEREEEKKNPYLWRASCVSEAVQRTLSNPDTLRRRYYSHLLIRNKKLRMSDIPKITQQKIVDSNPELPHS